MGGFNAQSSGMNRVRAHRRYQPNLQVTTLPAKNGGTEKVLACTRCRRTLTKSAARPSRVSAAPEPVASAAGFTVFGVDQALRRRCRARS